MAGAEGVLTKLESSLSRPRWLPYAPSALLARCLATCAWITGARPTAALPRASGVCPEPRQPGRRTYTRFMVDCRADGRPEVMTARARLPSGW